MMGYSIKKHEVNELLKMAIVLGWELVNEVYEEDGPTVTLHRKIPDELLEASGEIKSKFGSG